VSTPESPSNLHHAFTWIDDTVVPPNGRRLAVKDLIDVAGVPTTGGTDPRRSLTPTTDAPMVAALRRRGWEVVGKTNLHELALGPTSGNPHFGAVANPVDPTRIAGGSSGGSACAIGLGLADLAIGTDTGGSIRIPSALCGTAGWRPTHGRIPLDGVWPLAPSFDTIGPMARDVKTLAVAMYESDFLSPAALQTPTSYTLGAASAWADSVELDSTVRAGWDAVRSGHVGVDLPELGSFVGVGMTILYAEAAHHNRDRLEDRDHLMGEDVRMLLTSGAETRAVDYLAAQRARQGLRARIDDVFDATGVDAILAPTCAVVAPRIGSDPIESRHALTVFTRPFGITGHPVVALPAPTPGLPVGVQLIGRRGDDERLISIAQDLERRWAALHSGASRTPPRNLTVSA